MQEHAALVHTHRWRTACSLPVQADTPCLAQRRFASRSASASGVHRHTKPSMLTTSSKLTVHSHARTVALHTHSSLLDVDSRLQTLSHCVTSWQYRHHRLPSTLTKRTTQSTGTRNLDMSTRATRSSRRTTHLQPTAVSTPIAYGAVHQCHTTVSKCSSLSKHPAHSQLHTQQQQRTARCRSD